MRARDGGGTGRALVLAAAVLWGTTGTAQAFAPRGASPVAVGAARMAVGAAILVAAAWTSGGAPVRALPRAALAGAAGGMAAYQLFFFAAVERTGVAVGTAVAIGSAPVAAGALAWAVRGERPGPRWLAATTLAIAGCAVLVTGGRAIEVDAPGVALATGAGASYAAYAVATKRLLETTRPLAAAAVTFGVAAVVLLPALIASGAGWLASERGALVALHLGAVATAAAYVLFGRGLTTTPVATAATLSLAEPVTAAILGVAVLGERPTALAATGVALVLGGLAVASLPARRGAVLR
ncbi:MAG TPA: DMT family transporter [Actinomycetota bacterium]|nr:DMT family transporter [Actinomycetota bacterium]